MPFGTITSQSKNYVPNQPGDYGLSTLTFSDPTDKYTVRGAVKGNPLRGSVSRILQKDVVIGGATVRKTATVTVSVVVPTADFTPAEIDSLVLDISNFMSADTISRMLMGES